MLTLKCTTLCKRSSQPRSKIPNQQQMKNVEREKQYSVHIVYLLCDAGAFQFLDSQKREVGNQSAVKFIRSFSLEQRPATADRERTATARKPDGRTATANSVVWPDDYCYHCFKLFLLVTRTVSPKTKGLKRNGPMNKTRTYVRPNTEFMPILFQYLEAQK